MALSDDGQIFVWGGSLYGRRGQGKEVRAQADKYEPRVVEFFAERKIKITQIACGQNHSMAMTEHGSLFAWGQQQYYQCGLGQKSQDDIEVPQLVMQFETKPLKMIECGQYHSIAVTRDNELFTWGKGYFG